MDIYKDLLIRFIKCLDISLLGIYYLIGGITIAKILDKTTDNEKTIQKKATFRIIIEIGIIVSFIMIGCYILRNIVEKIPFIFDKFIGYDHHRVKELHGGVIISFAIIAIQSNFQFKINHLLTNRLNF